MTGEAMKRHGEEGMPRHDRWTFAKAGTQRCPAEIVPKAWRKKMKNAVASLKPEQTRAALALPLPC